MTFFCVRLNNFFYLKMKEIIVTVDTKDKKKVMMECTVAGLSRYVTAHEEYDEMNYKVNSFAKKELQKIFNHVNTDDGKKKLMFCEEQEVKYKLNRQNSKRSVVIENDNLLDNRTFTPSTWSSSPNILNPMTSSQNICNPLPSSIIINQRVDLKQKRMIELLEWVNTLPGILMLNQIQTEALLKSFEEFRRTQ